jgi:hypothetical protein
MYRRENYESFEKHLLKLKFELIDSGCFREAYLRDEIVIKVPTCTDGIIDNIMEAWAYKKYKNNPTNLGIFLAPCRLLPNNTLMMRTVNIDDEEPLPKWAKEVDTYQVGIYNGRYVAYDYALDLTERAKWEDKLGMRSEFFNSEGAEYYRNRAPKRKKKAA